MKKLQNNFTTTEQSKRLLELGVPAWTADCYCPTDLRQNPIEDATPTIIPYQLDTDEIVWDKVHALPCWSVGRLIEIHRASTTLPEEEYMFPFWYDTQDNVEWAIRVLESGIRTGNIDFSKLGN